MSTNFRNIATVSALVFAGMTIQRGVFTNFAHHELGLSAVNIGAVEAWREIPGLLSAVLALAAVYLTRAQLQIASVAFAGVGGFLVGWTTGFWTLVIYVLIQSIGFHLLAPVQEVMMLEEFSPSERGMGLGKLTSANAAASLAGMVLIFGFSQWLSYRNFYQIGGILTLFGLMFAFKVQSPAKVSRGTPLLFRWRYRSYYTLQMLAGARRQVVITFGMLALVALHGASVATIAILTAVHSVVAIFTRRYFGRAIDRWGEGRSLAFAYLMAAGVFLGYGFISITWLVYVIFIIDNALLGMDIALATHAGRLVDRPDLGPTLAMGWTANHITAVFLPVTGGLLWDAMGHRATFALGAAVCLAAVAVAKAIDRKSRPGAVDSMPAAQ